MAEKLPSSGAKEVGPEQRPTRSFWETVITFTPVFLTVLATLLAGLSNSEMTQAQYHRSLAAQFQSKVADQWSFFQAKRIRGSNLELTVDLLPSTGEKPSRLLRSGMARLHRSLERLEKQSEQLIQLVNARGQELGPAKSRIVQAAGQLQGLAGAQGKKARELQRDMASQLKTPQALEALSCLDARRLPSGNDLDGSAIIQETLESARKNDNQHLAGALPQEKLEQAIAQAEALAKKFIQKIKPLSKTIDDLTAPADQERLLLEELHPPVQELSEAREELPRAGKSSEEIRQALGTVLHTAAMIRSMGEENRTTFKAARYDFKARSYERESRYNQDLAELYEIQVRLTSLVSERHRHRSRNLFYGMLAAQGGVTIATFALAVRRKSVLWSMASMAGMGALAFGSYVYVYM